MKQKSSAKNTVQTVKKQVEALQASGVKEVAAKDIKVRFPYLDLSVLNNVKDRNDLIRVVIGDWDEQLIKKYKIDTSEDPIPVQAEFFAGVRACQIVEESSDLKWITLCNNSGLQPAMPSRYKKLKAAFNPCADSAMVIAGMFKMSLHDLMFGEQGIIRLPELYSSVARRLMKLDRAKQMELLKRVQQIYVMLPPNSDNNPAKPARDVVKLFNERVQVLADEMLLSMYEYFGPTVKMRARVNKLQNIRTTATALLSTMILTSILSGIAMDFFVSDSFSQYTPVYYNAAPFGEPKNFKRIDNQLVLRTLELLLAIEQPERHDIITDVLLER